MTEVKVTQVHNITPEEFKEAIVADFRNELQLFCKSFQPTESQEYLTREEVGTILKISMSTVSEWSKNGILNPYRLGNLVRFKKSELDHSLININFKKGA